jgi:hypothetical protein
MNPPPGLGVGRGGEGEGVGGGGEETGLVVVTDGVVVASGGSGLVSSTCSSEIIGLVGSGVVDVAGGEVKVGDDEGGDDEGGDDEGGDVVSGSEV